MYNDVYMAKKSFKNRDKKSISNVKSARAKNIAFAVLLSLIGWTVWVSANSTKQPESIPFSEVILKANSGEIKKIEITGDDLKVYTDKNSKTPSNVSRKESGSSIYEQGLKTDSSVEVKIDKKSETGSLWANVGLTLLPVILISAMLFYIMKSSQGQGNQAMSFGKSRARLYGNEKDKVTFNDIAGSAESKQDLEEVVEFLKFPKKFESVGAKIPKGVMLVGPPGTGKTMLARAVAGEAEVPFFSISGSEFVEMFVGVGASRVRDLFAKAKKNAPCIIFVDEIDAVGRKRGSGMGGGHDEREQTLNQILVEMDGFEQGQNVIVVAATNRVDVLDPALLRPGRFDRRVNIDLPDRSDRLAILKVHFNKKPLEVSVDLDALAAKTAGSSGADLVFG